VTLCLRQRVPRCVSLLTLATCSVLALPGCGASRAPATSRHRSARPPVAAHPAVISWAQWQQAAAAQLNAALRSARLRFRLPAATAAVWACGREVWAGATGVVDLTSPRPATNQTLFVLGSPTKTVIAAMTMQQIQAGRLSLSTPLSRFYPDIPGAPEITVRELLNMTSGLPDYLSNPSIKRVINHQPRHRWSRDQVLYGLGGGLGPPQFAPGTQYRYSDTNYIVLGGILERITGQSIQREFQRSIATPAGMTSSTFVPTAVARSQLAHPYLEHRGGAPVDQWVPGLGPSTSDWGAVWTDGGLASSSEDIARFVVALLDDRLLSPASVAQMTHTGLGHYGFGMQSRRFAGHTWLGHYGAFGGYETEDWSDPARRLTMAVMTNLQIVGKAKLFSDRIWKALVRTYDRMPPPPKQSCH
jgi:D-alanyl-D-alanine carboxypeptidase